jgi:hypothetical protein
LSGDQPTFDDEATFRARAPRPVRTVSFTLRANSKEELQAVLRFLRGAFPFSVDNGPVTAENPGPSRQSRFLFLVNGYMKFEMTPGGEARPTQAAALEAFKRGRPP